MFSQNISLKEFNTFSIDVSAKYFCTFYNITDLIKIISSEVFKQNKHIVLGGGSNILFTKNYEGLIIKNNIKGIHVINENENSITLRVASGENWHHFVMHCVNNNWGGIENLSLIPGSVGAAPMQNIGAYGVEVKDSIAAVHALNIETLKENTFSKEACLFGYRESIFKNKYKNKYIITAVDFILTKNSVVNVSYGAIKQELEKLAIKSIGIKEVSNAVIHIRQSKLPNPKEIGNAGSFFKNPVITKTQFELILTQFPEIVNYPSNDNIKLAAGWLIESCNLKGYEIGGAAVHTMQALVLINKNNATGNDVLTLAEHIQKEVQKKFGVLLEKEVNII